MTSLACFVIPLYNAKFSAPFNIEFTKKSLKFSVFKSLSLCPVFKSEMYSLIVEVASPLELTAQSTYLRSTNLEMGHVIAKPQAWEHNHRLLKAELKRSQELLDLEANISGALTPGGQPFTPILGCGRSEYFLLPTGPVGAQN
jgi:hypothetical protein